MTELNTAVVMDYQNVHLTGQGLYDPDAPLHECLIHPLHYANKLIAARNQKQREGYAPARLTSILVYRGLPSPEYDPDPYAWNQANKAEWERDPKVTVHHRR